MHTKFEVVLTWDDNLLPTGTECCKNDIKREITQRQYEVELQFLWTARLNIATNKHTKFQVIPT